MTRCDWLTLLRYSENGRPLSRAKDQAILEDVATKPIVAQMLMITMIETMIVVPQIELVAWANISIKGYLVGVFFSSSKRESQKRV